MRRRRSSRRMVGRRVFSARRSSRSPRRRIGFRM
ncbi:MAG: hypothetical protein [Microvirus sp.]|nr:MAG: hypothetical protein [Microvirus sp.]